MTNIQREIREYEDIILKHLAVNSMLQGRIEKLIEKLKQGHVWLHGDVFYPTWANSPMIYLDFGKSFEVYDLTSSAGPATNKADCLDGAKFLFNVREKI